MRHDPKVLQNKDRRGEDLCSLGLEVICSQLGVVNLEQDVGIADGGSGDLQRGRTKGTGQNAKVSDG